MMEEWQLAEDNQYVKRFVLPVSVTDDGIVEYYEASVKWDGCVNIWYHNPSTNDDPDYMHICRLEEHIETLSNLARKTKDFRE